MTNPLLEEFLSETRDALENIGKILVDMEEKPGEGSLVEELFRLVHTLKGASGIFDFPEMTRVLHTGEDLMSSIRQGEVAYSSEIADHLLEAMDFVSALCEEIESTGSTSARNAQDSARLAEALRAFVPQAKTAQAPTSQGGPEKVAWAAQPQSFASLEEGLFSQDVLEQARRLASEGALIQLVRYVPEEDSFFHGEDPFFAARQTPGLVGGAVRAREPWPKPAKLDAYRCNLEFSLLTKADAQALSEHFRYVAEEIKIVPLAAAHSGVPRAIRAMEPEIQSALEQILGFQYRILALDDKAPHASGRTRAAQAVLDACAELAKAPRRDPSAPADGKPTSESVPPEASGAEEGLKFGRRAEDHHASRVLKVDQEKVDRLMNLIGEMIVSKNALPYLAERAEEKFGVRELSREIKAHYAVINRIVEEMQDALMKVRMMPVSGVFQRFPRLVRDISRKLGKDIELKLEGEETEADKNIVEALADPLVHIVRNSLDHGIETPEVRLAAGKPAKGTLTIRATQDTDHVVIEVLDDGKGIDPEVVKRKALEKGLIRPEEAASMDDSQAVQLVFIPGFSTAETVSDLSGRGVGMDAVHSAVGKVNGTLGLESQKGKGTKLRISLPLSMAVTKIMLVESDKQLFGIPMEHVSETVRISRQDIKSIKKSPATVLRGQVLPLKELNALLGLSAPPVANADGELAVLVIRTGAGSVGLVVDDFHETLDVIQKPLGSVLAHLGCYSGSALMGNGTVLMVLNMKELF